MALNSEMDPPNPLTRIVAHLHKHSYYILPLKYYTNEEGQIPINVTLWKTDQDGDDFVFGITVHSKGAIQHQMFNITCSIVNASVSEEFVAEQIERVKRILARPLRPLCCTLGPNKTAMMEAVGMDKKALGIENCCVCSRETGLKTYKCAHNVCLYCLSKVERCPMCRNDDISCACCVNVSFESDNDDESDDDFAKV